MKNIHVLPTDKSTGIFKSGDNLLFSIINKVRTIHEGFHIYITNDEDIKEGDWFIDEFGITKNDTHLKFIGKKIILTTDGDLINEGVQAIDDEFLEWFVKNQSCEFVKVEVDLSKHNGQFQTKYGYKIIIPKEEPNPFELPKALPDDVFYESLEPKQETLEKAAERLYPYEIGYGVFDRNCEIDIERQRFVEGAKWQQEQDAKEIKLLREELAYEKRNKINKL